MKTKLKEALCGAAIITLFALGLLSVMGTKHQVGCGGDLWTYEETLADQTATFTTSAWDMGASEKLVMSLDFTEVSGAAPTVDCTIYSGTNRTKGYTTGTSFTQAKAATSETKTIVDGKFHQYIWAVCTMGGTITTVDVAVYATGKP